MLNGYKIIDADSHVIEPADMWGKYLEPKFREFAPSPDIKIKGEPITEKIFQQVQQEGNRQMMQAHPLSVEPSEPYLAEIIHYIGSDNLIFGSDYPHMDHQPNEVKRVVELEENLSQSIGKKIVWDNPRRFYQV